jgi:hypothetical protein
MIGKKGLSSIIATVAIILITIGAVGFIAGYVVPFVRNNLYESTECVSYQDYFTIEESLGYTCYTEIDGNYLYGLSIHAGSADSSLVKGIKLQFIAEGESAPADIFEGSATANGEGSVRMLNASKSNLEIPENGETRTYVYNSSIRFTRIDIYPVLQSGRLCDETDSIRMENQICLKPLTIS